MNDLLSSKKIACFLLAACFILFFCLSFFAQSTYDAGDGIRHYLISRYCWKHPDLLLYSWGKPFFTLISTPFSQGGLLGINLFNILCGTASAFLAFKIARKLNLNYAVLAIPFLLFTPCYFPTLNSGLTEPFFGLILIFSIYLMFSERYIPAAVIISFLPFVRTEGILILPLFFIVLIYRKKILLSPFLVFGTFVYSVIGSFYYNDFFWVKNQNPYNGENKSFYGSGELTHFAANHNFIWGSALGLLFIAGLAAVIFKLFKSIKNKAVSDNKLPEEIILIYGSFIIYFAAHSIMWWKGLANSLGLLRVIAGVVPCSAIICLRGFNLLMIPAFKKKKYIEFAIVCITVVFIISAPFKHEYFPYKLSPEQEVITDASKWFKTSAFEKQKIYYQYPFFSYILDVDPYNREKSDDLWGLYPSIKKWGLNFIPDSTIVFWDAHFGPNESRIPLDIIMSDPNFQLIKTFTPHKEFTCLGGYNFNVNVFMKLKEPKELQELSNLFYDFEENRNFKNSSTLIDKNSFSGKTSVLLDSASEYSAAVKIDLSNVPRNCTLIKFKAKILTVNNQPLNALVVFSIDDSSGENRHWDSKSINPITFNHLQNWKTFTAQFYLPIDLMTKSNFLSFYIWNKSRETFYLDDFEISYWGK